ncbi:MAG: hypothetical protein IPG71_07035 [bacterium]|nr:hypothetical protein [bacterium]
MLPWTAAAVAALRWSRWYFVHTPLKALNIELCKQRLVNLQNRLLIEAHVKKSIDPKGEFYDEFSKLIEVSSDPQIWIVDARQAIAAGRRDVTDEEARARFRELIELASKSGDVGRKIANEYVQASAGMLFAVNPIAKMVAVLTMHLFSRVWGTMTSRMERILEKITRTEDDILVLSAMNGLAQATGRPISLTRSLSELLTGDGAATC